MNAAMREMIQARGLSESDLPPLVYLVEEGSEDFEEDMRTQSLNDVVTLQEFIMDRMTPEERTGLKMPKYFYEVTFEKPGGIPMPIIAEYTYADGSKERITYPAQIWRLNDASVGKIIASEKEIVKIVVDPDEETADIDTTNNAWPAQETVGEFQTFKNNIKGQ